MKSSSSPWWYILKWASCHQLHHEALRQRETHASIQSHLLIIHIIIHQIMQLTKSTRNHYTVSYDSASHLSVLTQRWGSAWPRVLPYCVLNVIVMIALTFLDQRYSKSLKIEISAQGHNVCCFSLVRFFFAFLPCLPLCMCVHFEWEHWFFSFCFQRHPLIKTRPHFLCLL